MRSLAMTAPSLPSEHVESLRQLNRCSVFLSVQPWAVPWPDNGDR